MTSTEGVRGYPPLATLRGAVPGWDGVPLTAARTRDEAAAVLRAEQETSVLDGVCRALRRLDGGVRGPGVVVRTRRVAH